MKKLFTLFFAFFTSLLLINAQCDHTLRMIDSYGDGWNGASVDIEVGGTTVVAGATLATGTTGDQLFSASTGDAITLVNWVSGSYDSEISWEILDEIGTVIASGVHGDTPSGTGYCTPPPPCDHTLRMIDSYGDGWNGASVDIEVGGTTVVAAVTLSAGATGDQLFSAATGDAITLVNWVSGSYDSEISWEILDGSGTAVASGVHGDTPSATGACPSCLAPTALTASNITGADADLGWTAGGTESQWSVEYGPSGYTQGAGVTVSPVTTNPYTLTGLNSSTNYDFYVQADCGGGVSSTWAGPFSFSTAFVCPPNAECATYSDTTSTDRDFTTIPGASTCPSTVAVNIPTGYVIDSVSTLYDMSAVGGGWMSEQVSWINCTTTGAGEGSVYNGTGTSTGTLNYSRTGLTFANLAAGAVDFELHAGRSYGGSGCDNSSYNLVEPGWTIIAYYGLPPSCAPPSVLSASNLSSSSADLGWTVNGTETLWNIEYDISGFTQGAGTAVNGVNTNPYTLSGLNSNTSYDYYVQADCGGGITSTWVGPYTFTTPCGVLVAPYCQNFDALTPNDVGLGSCQTGDNIGDCWANDPSNTNNWVARSVSTSSTATGPSADHTSGSGNYVFIETSNCFSNTSYLWSAEMDVSSLTTPELSFWYHMWGTDMGSLTVEASTDAGTTWSGSLWNQAGDQQDQWREAIVDLSSYAGATSLIIRFEGISGTGFNSDMAIDDFCIQEAPPCPAPFGITIDSLGCSHAQALWTDGGSATSFQLQWDTTGFQLGTGNIISPTAGGTASPNAIISTLSGGTNYDVYVQSICGIDSSSWTGPVTFITPPCAPSAINCVSGGNNSVIFSEEFDNNNAGWTGNVGLGNGNWEIPDGATSTNTGADVAYSGTNYMNYEASSTTTNQGSIVSPAIDLTAAQDDAELSFWMHAYGASMGTLDIGVGTTATGPFTSVFTWSGQYQTAGSDPWVNVGVDLSSYVGQTIYIQLTQIDDVNNLGSGFDGDMSIDLFEVSTCVTCSQPTNLMASNITTTDADLLWTAGGNETTWNVVIDTAGFNPYAATAIVSNTDSLAITGLTSGDCYDFYVQADCGGDTSGWAGPYSFCTLPPPVCYYIIDMQDSYGDGWNGASIDVNANGVLSNVGLPSGSAGADTVYAYNGDYVTFSFNSGSWDSEITFQIYDPLGSLLGSYGTNPTVGLFLTDSSSNSICTQPADDLGLMSLSSSESSGCSLSDSVQICIDIFNYGAANQAFFMVGYSVNGNVVNETVGDTIAPGDTLTYCFLQTADLSANGTYTIDCWVDLMNDVDSTNNNISGLSITNTTEPSAPSAYGDTVCMDSGDTLTLIANSGGGLITWMDDQGNVVGTGDTLLSTANSTTTYWYEEASSSDTLSTTYAAGNGCGGGNMFDIIATNSISIDSFRTAFSGATAINVHYKQGSYVGSDQTPGDWTLLGSSSVTGAGAQVFSVGTPLLISAGDTVGIYIEAAVDYTTLTAQTTYNNNDLVISAGLGLCGSFSGVNDPRGWNGTVFYSAPPCTSEKGSVDAVVLDCTNILELGMLEFSLFPNPNNGEFIIVNDGSSEVIELSITDIQGKELLYQKLNFNKAEQKSITLENVERGVYLVRLSSESGIKIINMIVQ